MFDVFLDYVKKLLRSRIFPITIIYLVLFGIVIHRLFVLQIVEGPTIKQNSEIKKSKPREIDSPRGNIYDRDGKLLASNSLSYSVVMTDNTSIKTNEQKNAIIYQMIKLIEKNGDTVDSEFFIKQNDQGKLEFTVTDESALTRIKKNVYTYVLKNKKDLTDEQKKATAQDVYDFLRTGGEFSKQTTMFGLSDEYSVEDALKIMNIRYMLLCNYPKFLSITIASNVKNKTIAAIEENGADLIGVEVTQKANRVYQDSIYFSNIIGYTGAVNAEEYDAFQKDKKDYNLSDFIGKTGIEKTYEDILRGTKGSETVSVNSYGKVEEILSRKDPVAGNDIYLTINAELQKTTYHLLERKLADILLEFITSNMNYGTKGESDKNILIPIYEVYFALINNNIIDINHFTATDATDLEKMVYNKFKNRRTDVFNELNLFLKMSSTTPNKSAGKMEDYLDYFYTVMINNGILEAKLMPGDDQTLADYKSGKISLSKLLQYALAKNWVDLDKLKVGNEYYSTEELYQKLIDYTENILKEDSTFNKKIYRDLVFSYKLSGSEICLLLFDQGVLEYNEGEINNLKNGKVSAYNFIRGKINSLTITPAMLALEPCSGSVVITDPKNGDVLALVTYPSYDNNKYSGKIDSAYYNKIYNDLSFPSMNRPLMSKIIPGSTFKMITAFAALEENKIRISDKIFDEFEFEKTSPHAFCMHHHGTVNVVDAIKVSCNYFFYEMGWRLNGNSGSASKTLGLKKLETYATLLGLNKKSGIELGELSPQMSSVDAVRSSIGQGTNYFTPAQIANYANTLATRGKNYDLTVLDKVVNSKGKLIKDNSAKIVKNNTEVSSSTWNAVLEGMYNVANESGGTAYSYFKDFGVKVGGKTGTAQINYYHPSNALFVSFAPFDNPEVSVTVAIPNGYSSAYAAALAKNVYSYYFGYKDEKTLLQTNENKKKPSSYVD